MNRPHSHWLSLVFLLLLSSQVWGVESFTIKSIEVEGLQRISKGTIFNYLPVQVGNVFNDAKSQQTISGLYATGFFNDIKLYVKDDVLVIKVEERPSIAEITLSGNDEIGTEDLLEGLKTAGLAKGKIFDRSLLDRVEQDLQRQYVIRGYYAVEIKAEVSNVTNNRVNLNLTIQEGDVAKIQQINIIGNKYFDEDTLLDLFELGIPAFYAIFSDSDQYSKQKLSADLETLRSYYLDRGYINFNIESTQVSITPNKRSVFITVNIHEGEQYKISEIGLTGDLVVSEAELRQLFTLEVGDIFSRRKVTDISSEINNRLGEEGYAFANVNAVPEIKEDTKEVSLTFFIDPGKRVYVRRINITGNDKTEDEVIRREFRQMEGAWLSTSKLNRSRIRVQRLSYMEQVNIETPLVSGTDDQVDVNMSVTERPSGSLMVGIGYSGEDGMLLNASVSQENFLGTGKRVSTEINKSKVNKIYSFSHTDPYYTLNGVSQTIQLSYRQTDAAEANLASYIADVRGASLSYGIPLTEYNTARVGLGYDSTLIKTSSQTPQVYLDFLAANSNEFDVIKLSLGWSHDTRNKTVFPTEGLVQNLSTEIAMPASGLNYYKLTTRTRWFFPVTKSLTASLEGDIRFGDSYKETTDLPFFEKFSAGGAHSVRGYRANSLGPTASGVNIGGNLRVIANAELVFPPPFAPESQAVRMSLFWDAGNVFADTATYDTSELRQSAGLALIWLSPIGPLAFSFAEPLNDKVGDTTETFQFTLGTFF